MIDVACPRLPPDTIGLKCKKVYKRKDVESVPWLVSQTQALASPSQIRQATQSPRRYEQSRYNSALTLSGLCWDVPVYTYPWTSTVAMFRSVMNLRDSCLTGTKRQ